MAEDDHASSSDANKAILGYRDYYRQDGYDHIKGKTGKVRVYNKKGRIMEVLKERGTKPKEVAGEKTPSPGSYAHAKRYYFTYRDNYIEFGSPYPNQGHHLLPVEGKTEDGFFERFTTDQKLLLRKVDYDINNGANIMFLPTAARSAELQNLPIHKGKHPKYTNAVRTDAKGIQNALQKVIAGDPDHENWDPPGDIKQKLLDLQDDYWKLLKNAGTIKVCEFKKPKKKGLSA